MATHLVEPTQSAPTRLERVALVTGGGRGIGAATAVLLAQGGWDVCVAYQSDADAANDVAEECAALGVCALAVSVDVADEGQVAALFAEIDATWPARGALGVLVNNAGIVAPLARVQDMSAERVTRMFAVNVVGSFLCAGQAVTRMSTVSGGRGGVIVNVSSAASRIGSPGLYVDYAASKGAIDTMTLGLSKEVADEGIRVVAVRPGIINTEIHASGGQADRPERARTQIPMQRIGQPGEVAATIAWLCSDAASYVTGALVDVSGGR
jgi:NAD(P)-dependent dehydrogenase (short-subunit alcohol dehydrogenase family)